MELKHTNSNGNIASTIKFNLEEIFVMKRCENWALIHILYITISERCFGP